MTIGEKIEFLRTSKKITVVKLAELAGINSVLLRKYETNLTTPKSNQIKKIATALNISPYALTSENNYFEVNTVGDLYSIIIFMYNCEFIKFAIEEKNNIVVKINPLVSQFFNFTIKSKIIKELPNYELFIQWIIKCNELEAFIKTLLDKNNPIAINVINKCKEEIELIELELQSQTQILNQIYN